MTDIKYSTLYNISLTLTYDDTHIINISPSDIVSITVINNYDTMTFPIIRIRLYSDISVMQRLSECPNNIIVRANIDGNIYKVSRETETVPEKLKPISSICFDGLKGYIKQKNIATSTIDQYVNGVKRDSDLNEQVKVPIEILCYNETLVSNMYRQVPSIYQNVSIEFILRYLLNTITAPVKKIDAIENQKKYDQFIIPNLQAINSFGFIDEFYGLYKKGGQLYCDIDGVYVSNTDVNNGTKPLAFHIRSAKSNGDLSGLRKFNDVYLMGILATNVSVISETELQKAIQSNTISSVDLNNFNIVSTSMTDALDRDNIARYNLKTVTHKTENQFITDMHLARVKESDTIISISGNGFDINAMKVNSRYNLVWESPQRGVDINKLYRPIFTNHVFSNLDSKLFLVETTMNLVTN